MGFSVLMSVYKKEKPEYLQEAMESVFNQSLVPDEVVLMEDGPLTEGLEQAISELKKKHPQIVTYSFEENVQLGRALAKGVELCSHELIARMDTDDIAVYDRFRHEYDYMTAHPTVAVCGGWMQEFNDEGTYSRRKQMPQSNEEIRRYGKYRNPVNHMTVMFRKQAVLTAGNYRHMPLLEDYDLWSRMLVRGMEFYNLPEVLVRMRNNNSVYERRGGMAYFRQYAAFRWEQKKMGWLCGREYLMALILTMGVTLQPNFVRKIIYRRMLRR